MVVVVVEGGGAHSTADALRVLTQILIKLIK